jgi:hypothetical protein
MHTKENLINAVAKWSAQGLWKAVRDAPTNRDESQPRLGPVSTEQTVPLVQICWWY